MNATSEQLRATAKALATQAAALLERPDLGERPQSLALAITNGTAAIVLNALADVIVGASLEQQLEDSIKKTSEMTEYFNVLRTANATAFRTGDWTEHDRLASLGLAGYKAEIRARKS